MPNSWVHKTQEVSKRGIPDILMCLAGVFIAIELKTDSGKLTELQKYNLKNIVQNGKGLALTIKPSNWHYYYKLLQLIANKGYTIVEDIKDIDIGEVEYEF